MSLNTTAVRIKVTLKDVKPEVMRRLVVPVTLRLDRLHLTLQAAFGWTNSHLFEFFAGEVRWGIPDPDNDYCVFRKFPDTDFGNSRTAISVIPGQGFR